MAGVGQEEGAFKTCCLWCAHSDPERSEWSGTRCLPQLEWVRSLQQAGERGGSSEGHLGYLSAGTGPCKEQK